MLRLSYFGSTACMKTFVPIHQHFSSKPCPLIRHCFNSSTSWIQRIVIKKHLTRGPQVWWKERMWLLFPKADCFTYSVCWSTVLFFSRPRSEGWPNHGHTFSIYLCLLSFWLTLPQGVLSTSWCCPSRPCVIFLACVHLALLLALSLSPVVLPPKWSTGWCHQCSEGLWPSALQFVVHLEIHRGSPSSPSPIGSWTRTEKGHNLVGLLS